MKRTCCCHLRRPNDCSYGCTVRDSSVYTTLVSVAPLWESLRPSPTVYVRTSVSFCLCVCFGAQWSFENLLYVWLSTCTRLSLCLKIVKVKCKGRPCGRSSGVRLGSIIGVVEVGCQEGGEIAEEEEEEKGGGWVRRKGSGRRCEKS